MIIDCVTNSVTYWECGVSKVWTFTRKDLSKYGIELHYGNWRIQCLWYSGLQNNCTFLWVNINYAGDRHKGHTRIDCNNCRLTWDIMPTTVWHYVSCFIIWNLQPNVRKCLIRSDALIQLNSDSYWFHRIALKVIPYKPFTTVVIVVSAVPPFNVRTSFETVYFQSLLLLLFFLWMALLRWMFLFSH